MIERLKFLIDQSEGKPALKVIFLNIAAMPEDEQEAALALVESFVNNNRRQVTPIT